jgi:hypothetical protein
MSRAALAVWLRLHRVGAAIGRQRATDRELARLDERTLKDIGLEPWRSALGARIEMRRRQDLHWSARAWLY